MIETSVMKELSIGKSAGVDMMSPKLVKLAANYLAGPLSQSINNGIKKEHAKAASVTLVEKKTHDKNSVLNFHPTSALNCFSKVMRS